MPIPPGYDWQFSFRPAALALLAGHSPYAITSERFVNAPWTLIPLMPLAGLQVEWGRFLLILMSLVAFAFVAYKLGASPIAMAAFMLSPFVILDIYYGQINWLPLLGLVVPPWIGLFFIVTKPQVCGLVALYWLIEAWKAHTVIKTFAPVTIAILLSFVPFGFWPIGAMQFETNNILWPWSLVLSAALFVVACRRKDKTVAVVASPFASPYFRYHSLAGILLPFIRYQWLMVIISALLWIVR